MLIKFILWVEGILKEPILYLSLYFKANRQAYYDHQQSVRETWDWEEWIRFFLTGIIDTANQATEAAQAIMILFGRDRSKIKEEGKPTAAVLTIYNYFQGHPISNTTKVKAACSLSLPTVLRSLPALEKQGIIEEITGKEHTRYLSNANI